MKKELNRYRPSLDILKPVKKKGLKKFCNHKITYPTIGMDDELENIMETRDVWYCDLCKRFVVDERIEKE